VLFYVELIGCIIFGVGEGILSETEIAHLNNSLAPFFGCIIFGVGEGILSDTEIAHLNNSLAPFFCLNVENK
jgi:4-hydroxy-3-methylbut-2-en-1-yl diphosphate synthase IspG/GcpE